MRNENLMELAMQARENAYAPYSNFKVGAAILTTDGSVFVGCNVENSCGTSCCAERVAIHNAISQGHNSFTKIAIAALDGTFPCGICRQVIAEFSDDIVILVNQDGSIREYTIGELLPHTFKR